GRYRGRRNRWTAAAGPHHLQQLLSRPCAADGPRGAGVAAGGGRRALVPERAAGPGADRRGALLQHRVRPARGRLPRAAGPGDRLARAGAQHPLPHPRAPGGAFGADRGDAHRVRHVGGAAEGAAEASLGRHAPVHLVRPGARRPVRRGCRRGAVHRRRGAAPRASSRGPHAVRPGRGVDGAHGTALRLRRLAGGGRHGRAARPPSRRAAGVARLRPGAPRRAGGALRRALRVHPGVPGPLLGRPLLRIGWAHAAGAGEVLRASRGDRGDRGDPGDPLRRRV
ncbi:MAG: Menaquinone via futalosine step 1, partial [uncultured Gemmatimonadetes bacterium]